MYKVVLTVSDIPGNNVAISLDTFKLSEETLTPERKLTIEEAEELCKSDMGALGTAKHIMTALDEIMTKVGR